MAPASNLPSHQEFLTSLFNAIGSVPAVTTGLSSKKQQQGEAANPLKSIRKPEDRALLATLHVLYPALLLPALDLLDRNLVSRVFAAPAAAGLVESDTGEEYGGLLLPDDGLYPQSPKEEETHHHHKPSSSTPKPTARQQQQQQQQQKSSSFFYLVRSAQQQPSTSSRKQQKQKQQQPQQTYLVRPGSPWNCSCPAFAYASFPASTSSSSSSSYRIEKKKKSSSKEEEDEGRRRRTKWQFGGLLGTADPDEEEEEEEEEGKQQPAPATPCCKHLLACVLAERWPGVLGSTYVEERGPLGREEMAGLVGGC